MSRFAGFVGVVRREWPWLVPFFVLVVLPMGYCGVFGVYSFVQQVREEAAFRGMVGDVRPLVENCRSIGAPEAIALRGTALVWDIDSNSWFGHRYKIENYLNSWAPQADPGDEQMTVFLVSTTRLDKVGSYNMVDPELSPAYRARYDVCVIYWPEKRPIGMHTLYSDPSSEVVTSGGGVSGEVVGNPLDVYSWVENLPRTQS